MRLKHQKTFFLLLLLTFSICFLIFFAVVSIKPEQPQQLNLPYNFSATSPIGWSAVKRPLPNQVVLSNKKKGDGNCFIDIFVVIPDKEYTFQGWLSTTITNEIFLKTGKQTTFNGMDAFIGSYNFVDNYFREVVNHKRTIFKKNGTLADIHLTYKNNESCSNDYQNLINSVLIK